MLTGLSRFWFAETGGDRAEPPARRSRPRTLRRDGRDPDACRELRGRMMLCRRADGPPDRGRSSAATSRARAGRTTSGRARSAGSRSRPACARATACPEPIFTPVDEGRGRRPRREHRLRRDGVDRLVGAEHRRSGSATVAIALVRAAASAIASRRGIILADTKFEFGIDRATGELLLHRRGPDARTRRGSGTPRPTSRAGPQASFDKQFVRDWLETQAVGQDARPARSCPPDVVDGHAGPLRRGVRADHRRELRALPRGGRRCAR